MAAAVFDGYNRSMLSLLTPLRPAASVLTLALALLAGCGDRANSGADHASDGPAGKTTHEQADTEAPAWLAHPPEDPRSALTGALASGLLADIDAPNDRLRAVLHAAGVSEASQVLVFSKTSLQDRLISPRHPRAIYFNDDCYIGYVPGGLIEYGDADQDPAVGSGLFALDPRDGADATLTASTQCLSCHGGSRTNNRPGFLVRSVFPDAEGFPITSAGSHLVGHDTPLRDRWGGWYVTGEHGDARHMGNMFAIESDNGNADYDREPGANITDLSPYFNTDRYLEPTSDIVALMVLEHQVTMHNLLTQGSSLVHEQAERSRSLAEYLEEPFDPAKNETLQRVIASNAEKIVNHLLFCDEIALTQPVVGGEAFQQAFRANRREDQRGRSLKDFDLRTRMFKYRCSYMVYSRAFGLMPGLLKDAVVQKLRAILTGADNDPAYEHLPAEERRAILGILRETGVL